MTVHRRTAILVSLFALLGLPGLPFADQGADILDSGIVVRGQTKQDQMNDAGKTIAFSVSSDLALIVLRAPFDNAFGERHSQPKTELGALIFRRLLKHATANSHAAVRFAQWRDDLPAGTFVNKDSLPIALCVIAAKDKGFHLQCVDAMRSGEHKAGEPYLFDAVVVPGRGSALDRHLRDRRTVLMRVEE